ncbi:MAG: ABC transporter substrate-binding protein [Actinobacteria bacterium]|nr:ABC transporter substrate-binding protein [Actinomycetota bacterium]
MRRLALVALLVTGCTAIAATPVKPAPAQARTGGVLRVGITAPGSLDPGNDYEPMGDLVLRTLCDPLIAADPATGELEPALVESWVVSDSGQRLVLRLRKGLRFSDGTPLTSDDVAYSLSRIASADYASAAAGQLEAIDGYPEVHGDQETDDDADRRRLHGVRTLDEQSVEITLRRRQADFLRVLTSRLTTPVPREAATADSTAFARKPVCSGPYTLDQPFAAGATSVRLTRRPGYRGVDTTLTGGGKGYADAVEFRVYPDAAAAAAAQRAGQVDVAAAAPSDTAGVQSGPGPLVEYVGFPTSTGPVFDKPVVRRALALALDREQLVQQVFPGTRTAATGFLPPTTRPVFTETGCADLPVGGDVGQARALLAAENVSLTGVRVPLYLNPDGRNLQLARAVAAQWKAAVGLTAVPTPLPFDDLIARGTSARGFDGPFRFSEQLLCRQLPMLPLTFSLARYLVAPTVAAAGGTYLDRTTGQPLLRELYVGR